MNLETENKIRKEFKMSEKLNPSGAHTEWDCCTPSTLTPPATPEAQPRAVRRNATSNPFCGPAALSIITGLHVDECVKLIQQRIGNKLISGIYFPTIIEIAQDLGFRHYRTAHFPLSSPNPVLVVRKEHFVVIWDGILYDNQHPNGTKDFKRTKSEMYFEMIPNTGKSIL